ncbi:MAG: ACT domain-containing protein [Clostridia bacterium]|nr:ACT domain-containing protein [Clostridia bacterium]
MIKLHVLDSAFAVCKLASLVDADLNAPCFLSITEDEVSLVCEESRVPAGALRVERRFRCLKIEGPLDFGMVGIIAGISTILTEHGVSIFVVSTYDTDYVLVKEDAMERAVAALSEQGYAICN